MIEDNDPGVALPKIISVDDHVIEPPHLFKQWLPPRYRERGPSVIRKPLASVTLQGGAFEVKTNDEGTPTDWWQFEDTLMPLKRTIAWAGQDFTQEAVLTGVIYEDMRPGFYDPKARLADMDRNWTESSLCFPTFPRFCGQTFYEAKDRELGLACVIAYNDWMVEEWCGDSDGRLIPLCLIPLWDAELAAQEVRRNAARGVRAVAFSETPAHLGLPSIHDPGRFWDPFFNACAETGTAICMHIGSSSRIPTTSVDAPPATLLSIVSTNAMGSLADWLFSGNLVRFPRLKIAFSESQIGWIPFLLERCDNIWSRLRSWGDDPERIPEPPSSYYYRQVFGCFFDDHTGLEMIDRVGENNIMFETDYPHSDGTWPNSRESIEKLVSRLSASTTHKILRGNAIKLLSLNAS